jgi:xanthine dehydrogenase accessory factor
VAVPDESRWPFFGQIDDVRPLMRQLVEADKPFALATLHAREGASPRDIGSQMIFAGGVMGGYFSGGCIEADVAKHADEVLAHGWPQWLVYGEGSPWIDLRLPCGSRIEILVERVWPDDAAVTLLLGRERQRQACVWVSDGSTRVCLAEATTPLIEGHIARHYSPPIRLIIAGDDPSALAMAELGAKAGFETTLLVPFGPDQAPALEGVRYRRESARLALEESGLDRWTAVIAASHDGDRDHDVLMAALASDCGYVGAMGSRNRLPERIARLAADGIAPDRLAALHAPVGIALGGKAPWEIALSVCAEVTAWKNGM